MVLNDKTLKICVSSEGKTLDSEIDPRFGRCKYFLLVDVKDKEEINFKAIKNVGALQGAGAGISAAEQIGKLGVDLLITGDIGPKANNILDQLGIKVVKASGSVKTEIRKYINNEIVTSKKNVSNSISKNINNVTIKTDQRMFIPLMNNNGENSEISFHFGHAPYFGLYDLMSKEITIKANKLNHSDPNKSPVDQIIESVNPTMVFAQDMGIRAINLFTEKNIKLKTGSYKTVKEVVDNIDELVDLTKGCGH